MDEQLVTGVKMKEQILEIKRELLLLKKNDIDFFLRG